jgi:hypothetical protein
MRSPDAADERTCGLPADAARTRARSRLDELSDRGAQLIAQDEGDVRHPDPVWLLMFGRRGRLA